MTRILACTNGPDDWKRFLAKPEKHWRPGFSAHSLAHRWEAAEGLPPEVAALLETAPDGATAVARPFLATPEYRVDLPGGERASQTDLMVFGRARGGAFALAVEGKVEESFGPTLHEWNPESSDGKRTRWSFLCDALGLDVTQPGELRYQLFHRTVSAILTARQHHASLAAILVHSFSPHHAGLDDFAAYGRAFGAVLERGRLGLLTTRADVRVYAGWATAPKP